MQNLTSSITVVTVFLNQLRNQLIVQDGLREIRIDGSAEAKKNDITEQLWVISRSISNERLIARFKHRLI
jgi:hypothetical protein